MINLSGVEKQVYSFVQQQLLKKTEYAKTRLMYEWNNVLRTQVMAFPSSAPDNGKDPPKANYHIQHMYDLSQSDIDIIPNDHHGYELKINTDGLSEHRCLQFFNDICLPNVMHIMSQSGV